MKLLPMSLLLLAATATIPAICQSSAKSTLIPAGGAPSSSQPVAASQPPAPGPAAAPAPTVTPGALRSDIARQDRVIKGQIDNQQALLKKNKELMKAAAKLDEKNKKLEEKNKKLEEKNRAFNSEKRTIEAQNADLVKKHEAIKAAERPITVPSN